MSQAISSTEYTQSVTTTSTKTLPNYQEVSFPTANTVRIAHWSSLKDDATAIAQQDSVTISGSIAADDVVWIQIAVSGGTTVKYAAIAVVTDTLTTLAAKLAAAVNLDANVYASSALGVITITSVIPGQAFTTTSGKTGTVTMGSPATGTANSGTALTRKLMEVDVVFGDSTDGYLTATPTIRSYNGAASPTLVSTQTAAAYKHPSSIDTIRTAQGGL